ncbi:MAG: S-layer homology domain-containing protein [Clostridia bacterium]|nr:S-layer homology domain-containing protein [Clostridia bacterium]
MIKKNKLLILTVCLMYMFSVAVNAAGSISARVTDGVNGVIEITGTSSNGQAGEKVNLLVTNGASLTEAEAAPESKVQYQNAIITEENGSFKTEFQLYFPQNADGEVTLNIFAGGEAFLQDEVLSTSLYYASMGLKLVAAKAICDATTNAGGLIDSNKAVFAIESPLYNSLDKAKLAELLKNMIETGEIAFLELNDENLAKNIEMYGKFEEKLKHAIAVDGFNQGKKEYIVKDNILEPDELLGLTKYLQNNGTLCDIYSKSITSAGVSAVIDGLFGKDAKSVEDLQKIFAKQVILNGIKNNVKGGSGTIQNILTSDNIKAAGLNVPKYQALTSTFMADDALYQQKSVLTYNNLEEKIEAYADIKETIILPSSGSPSGGGGGGKGSGSLSVTPSSSVSESQTSSNGAFSDLSGYEWANTAIDTLSERKIISGVGNNAFNPAGTLTREAAAKIICLALSIEQGNYENPFSDVDSGMWYAPYITALNVKNIVKGINKNSFGVGMNVTREDFAVIICRALNLISTGKNSFTDANSISPYAVDAVNALYEKGIISGYTDGSFKPKANITRAEGAVVIYNVLLNM